MRALSVASVCVALLAAAAPAHAEGSLGGFPWPFHTATTTPAPSAVSSFQGGVAEALGLRDVESCAKDADASATDLWYAMQDFLAKNVISKAKAFVKMSEALKMMTEALGPCAASTTDAEKYHQLLKDLRDPRYYTPHNALTLILNVAEDHAQLAAFAAAWERGDFHAAGAEIIVVILDVLEHPDIPRSNGTEAVQIAEGLAEGLAKGVDLPCFKGARMEVASLVGGVMDILSAVHLVAGLESLFHGIVGAVPTYKACASEKSQIMDLLRSADAFKHPRELAERFGHNIIANGVDLSLETASAVLDYKGKEWSRFGQDIGKILGKVVLGSATSVAPAAVLV